MAATRSCSISRPSPIAEAARRRADVFLDGEVYRAFHGESEGVPGLAIDRFDDVAVLHAASAGLLARWWPIAQRELDWCLSAYGKVHARAAADGTAWRQPLWGPPRENLEVVENGVRYDV